MKPDWARGDEPTLTPFPQRLNYSHRGSSPSHPVPPTEWKGEDLPTQRGDPSRTRATGAGPAARGKDGSSRPVRSHAGSLGGSNVSDRQHESRRFPPPHPPPNGMSAAAAGRAALQSQAGTGNQARRSRSTRQTRAERGAPAPPRGALRSQNEPPAAGEAVPRARRGARHAQPAAVEAHPPSLPHRRPARPSQKGSGSSRSAAALLRSRQGAIRPACPPPVVSASRRGGGGGEGGAPPTGKLRRARTGIFCPIAAPRPGKALPA